MGLKLNTFINVMVSLSPCVSRFRNDFWKWRRSHYGSFSMLLWQAKMLILPGRRPYTRSSASWTVRSQRFLNLPIVCRSFCMSNKWRCLILNNFTFPQICMKSKVAFLKIFKFQLLCWLFVLLCLKKNEISLIVLTALILVNSLLLSV